VRPPTITRLVQNLERRKLIRRVNDADDARVSRVAATTTGRKLFLAGHERRLRPLAEAIRVLPTVERERLATALPILERLCTAETDAPGRALAGSGPDR